MSIIDIIIVLLVAAMAVFGFYKGFIKSVISLLGFLLSLVIVLLLAKAVANALLSVNTIGGWVAGEKSSLYTWLYSKMPAALEEMTSAKILEANSVKELFDTEAPWYLKLLYPLVSSGLDNSTYLAGLDNARQIAALELSYGLFTLITGAILFVVVRILAAVFSLVFKKYSEGKKRFSGRLAGAFIGAVKAVLYSMIILCIFTFVSNFKSLQPVNKAVEESTLAKGLTSVSVKISSAMLKDKEGDARYARLVELATGGKSDE